MSLGNTPAVFISSTFYDLKHVRADMENFIESLGMRPILSELPTFPINPDQGTVENCLRIVDQNADILVLIVGGRYGSVIDENKSISNMEYLRARSKGIPIYVFVDKSILALQPAWKKNPGADWSEQVDTPKLFEFVENLKGENGKGVWVFPFERAKDITDTLKTQFAYLFKDCLAIRRKLNTSGLPESLSRLRGTALKYVIEQPPYWESWLFGAVLQQQIDLKKSSQLDLKFDIVLGPSQIARGELGLVTFLSTKFREARNISRAAQQLINVALPDAMKPDGTPADPELVVYVAERLALVYGHAVNWSHEVKRAFVDEQYERLIQLFSSILDDAISAIEQFPSLISSTLEKVADLPKPEIGKDRERPLVLTFEFRMEEYNEEYERIFGPADDFDDGDDSL